jgi:hypothetical protein
VRGGAREVVLEQGAEVYEALRELPCTDEVGVSQWLRRREYQVKGEARIPDWGR